MAEALAKYPVNLTIDYPDRNLNRLTSFFRFFTAIPIGIVMSFLAFGLMFREEWPWWLHGYVYVFAAFIIVPTAAMILFRQKYPQWWFDWNVAIAGFMIRVFAYLTLLRDEYPSTDEEQAVHIDIPYPNVKEDLDRGMPLVKWILAIPHYIVLFFLDIAVVVAVIIAWFAVLFTGRYPRGFFDLVVAVFRWNLRVIAYAFLMTTDRYPPFSLNE